MHLQLFLSARLTKSLLNRRRVDNCRFIVSNSLQNASILVVITLKLFLSNTKRSNPTSTLYIRLDSLNLVRVFRGIPLL